MVRVLPVNYLLYGICERFLSGPFPLSKCEDLFRTHPFSKIMHILLRGGGGYTACRHEDFQQSQLEYKECRLRIWSTLRTSARVCMNRESNKESQKKVGIPESQFNHTAFIGAHLILESQKLMILSG